MRLFFAVDLPDDLADEFAALQDRFADAEGLNFTDPEQAHVTLKFLGEVDEAEISSLESAAETAIDDCNAAPFEMEVGGLGVFPSLDYISVVWAGVRDGSADLVQLHEALEVETTALGFEAESHAFTPHLTLARMEYAAGKELVQDLVTGEDPTVGRFEVDAVRLKQSVLTGEGPEYETVTSFPL